MPSVWIFERLFDDAAKTADIQVMGTPRLTSRQAAVEFVIEAGIANLFGVNLELRVSSDRAASD